MERPSPLRGLAGRFGRGKRDARAELTLAASPQAVWALITDVERIGDWWPRAVSGVIVEGDEIGREQVVTFDWGRRHGTVRQRVTQWEPQRRYGWRVTDERFGDQPLKRIVDTRVNIDISRDGALARVAIQASYEPIAPRGALALRQMAKLANRTFKEALKRAEAALGPQ